MDESTVAASAAPEGGEAAETTTASEVASVLGLDQPETETIEAEESVEEVEVPVEESPVEAPVEEAVAEEVAPVAAPETLDTPSFAIEVEDVNGEKIVVNPGDNLEEVLASFEPKNNGQVISLVRDLIRAEDAKEAYEKDQVAQAEQAQNAETISNIQAGWDKEIAALQASKRLDVTVGDKPNERVRAVYKFMAEENDKRTEDGRPLPQSFEDALDKLELNEKKGAEKEAARAAKEETRRVGGMVGGSSAPASSGGPVYRAGTARSATEAARSLGLI